MKNITKATIAGAAGIVLLAGGTTFALWSDSTTVNGGSVTAGTLALDPVGTPAWNDTSTSTAVPIADITAFRIVPGDTVEYTSSFTVNATGDNLTADLTVSNPVAATGDAALIAATTVTQTFTDAAGDPITNGEITSDNNGDEINVTVTIAFASSTPDKVAQGETLDLSDLTVTLQQTRP